MEFIQDFGTGYGIERFDGSEGIILTSRVKGTTETLRSSFIITPNSIHPNWPPRTVAHLTHAHLGLVLELAPKVFLLGTGPTFTIVDDEQLAPLHQAKIPVEVMDSASACRTYNVLMSEERDVAAGIIF